MEVNVARDRNEAINSYITDMLALEDHIEKAIRGQLEDLKDYPDVTRDLKVIHRQVEHHVSDLRALSERRNARTPADVIKRVGSALLGLGAAAVDLIRTEGLPKNLRDDYTALSLASIGYVMLHTTATALDDLEVADLGRQHFADYAEALTVLQGIIPEAVVRYLKEEGFLVRGEVLPEINRTIEEVWSSVSARSARTAESPAAQNR
jgi:hypothetical protein